MRFNNNKIEEQEKLNDIDQEGIYQFKIISVKEKKSEYTGGEYLSLLLKCENNTGIIGKIYDSLSDSDKSAWRRKQLANCTGLPLYSEQPYDITPPMLTGAKGWAKINWSKESDGFPSKLRIAKYLTPAEAQQELMENSIVVNETNNNQDNILPNAEIKSAELIEDDLPF